MSSIADPSVHVPLTYFLAGGLCACSSHAVAIPIDVVKTKQQTSPELEKLGSMEAFSKILYLVSQNVGYQCLWHWSSLCKPEG